MAAQDLTYNDIKLAILEALSEHDSEVARYGSADTKLHKETNDLTSKLLSEIEKGLKHEKESDEKLIKEIKNNFKESINIANQSNKDTNTNFEKNSTKLFNKLDNYVDKFLYSAIGKTLTALQDAANNATQIAVNTLKNLNSQGVAQSWYDYKESLRDSTISIENLNKAISEHGNIFASLNKMTGNAVGTYQKLASKASDYATREAKVAYDEDQIVAAVNSYINMQKSTGNLEKLNQAELQKGVNKLILSADKLSKEFGISRDALIKDSEQVKMDMKIAYRALHANPEQVAEIQGIIEALRKSGQDVYADTLENLIRTRGFDKESLTTINLWQNSDLMKAARLFQAGGAENALEGARLFKNVSTSGALGKWYERQDYQQIYNSNSPEWQKALYGAMQNIEAQPQINNKNKFDKDTQNALAKEQDMRNSRMRLANNVMRDLTRSVENATAYFNTMNLAIKGVNEGLKAFGDALTGLNNLSGGFLGSVMGYLSGTFGILGTLAQAWVTYRTYSTLKELKDSLQKEKTAETTKTKNEKAKGKKSEGKAKGGKAKPTTKPKAKTSPKAKAGKWALISLAAGYLAYWLGIGSSSAEELENEEGEIEETPKNNVETVNPTKVKSLSINNIADSEVGGMSKIENEKTEHAPFWTNQDTIIYGGISGIDAVVAGKAARDARVAQSVVSGGAKAATITGGDIATGAIAGAKSLVGGIVLAGVDYAINEYGPGLLEDAGMKRRDAQNVSNYTSAALTGAAIGALGGPWGAAIGGAAGVVIQGIYDLFTPLSEEEKEADRKHEEEKQRLKEEKAKQEEKERHEALEYMKQEFPTLFPNSNPTPEINYSSVLQDNNEILTKILYTLQDNNKSNV